MWCCLCLQLAAPLVQSPSPSSCWVATGDGPWFAEDRGCLHGWCSSRWGSHERTKPAGAQCSCQWSCKSWQELAGSSFVNWILLPKIWSKSLFLLKPEEDTVKALGCVMLPSIKRNIALFEGSHALAACSWDKSSFKMSMEQCWNDADRGKLKYWEKNIIQCGW